MDITGKISEILEAETGTSAKGEWSKQGFIIDTQDQYPKKVFITIWNGKIPISEYNTGDIVRVFINLQSREYNGRWYTDVQAWRMENASAGAPSGSDAPPPLSSEDEILSSSSNKEDINDLPF